jgi:hypothetical protein
MDRTGRVRPTVAMRITGHETDSMWKRCRNVDGDDIGQAFRATQEYVSQQAAEKKKLKVIAMAEAGVRAAGHSWDTIGPNRRGRHAPAPSQPLDLYGGLDGIWTRDLWIDSPVC